MMDSESARTSVYLSLVTLYRCLCPTSAQWLRSFVHRFSILSSPTNPRLAQVIMHWDAEKQLLPHETSSAELGSIRDVNSRTDMGHLHRQLGNRQIQLIAAGGSVGTAISISIGSGLAKAGPGSLLLAFVLKTILVSLTNNSVTETDTCMPVAGGFVSLAGFWVDNALLASWQAGTSIRVCSQPV